MSQLRLGRPLLIGFILVLAFWMAMIVVVGIMLDGQGPVGAVSFGLGPFELASGTTEANSRGAGLAPFGFVLAAVIFLLPTAIYLVGVRHRRREGAVLAG